MGFSGPGVLRVALCIILLFEKEGLKYTSSTDLDQLIFSHAAINLGPGHVHTKISRTEMVLYDLADSVHAVLTINLSAHHH